MTPYANILLESNVVFKREREIEMNATALLIGLGPLLGWGFSQQSLPKLVVVQ